MVVYKITNLLNNKNYIGCSVNYEKRIKEHKTCKFKGAVLLHKAFLKYGIENFSFCILQSYFNIEEMFLGEINYIKDFNSINPSGYNLHHGGKGGKIQLSESQMINRKEIAKKLKEINIGNKYNLGRKLTDEHKEKLSKSKIGKSKTEETKKRMSESKKGISCGKGKIITEEWRKNISKSKIGKLMTEETKQKMSKAAKVRQLNSKRDVNGRFIKQIT